MRLLPVFGGFAYDKWNLRRRQLLIKAMGKKDSRWVKCMLKEENVAGWNVNHLRISHLFCCLTLAFTQESR